MKSCFILRLLGSSVALTWSFSTILLISFQVFLTFVKDQSVESAEVRESDCYTPHVSALLIRLVSLLIIDSRNASHVLLWSSIRTGWAFCLSPVEVNPRINKSVYFPVRWFLHDVCASASAPKALAVPCQPMFWICECNLLYFHRAVFSSSQLQLRIGTDFSCHQETVF